MQTILLEWEGDKVTYLISDVHGCYDRYEKMLKRIKFSDDDLMYVLGDVVDYGPQPLAVLRDMSMRANVIPILGNHEYAAYEIIRQFSEVEFTEDGIKARPGSDIDLETYTLEIQDWIDIGGGPTLNDFKKLSDEEREDYLEYLEEFSLYEVVKIKGKIYVLTHSGVPKGATKRTLEKFDAYEYTTATTDYDPGDFENVFLITGHYPPVNAGEEERWRIYRKGNHIALDTGAVLGETLACLCLDTDKEFYV